MSRPYQRGFINRLPNSFHEYFVVSTETPFPRFGEIPFQNLRDQPYQSADTDFQPCRLSQPQLNRVSKPKPERRESFTQRTKFLDGDSRTNYNPALCKVFDPDEPIVCSY